MKMLKDSTRKMVRIAIQEEIQQIPSNSLVNQPSLVGAFQATKTLS